MKEITEIMNSPAEKQKEILIIKIEALKQKKQMIQELIDQLTKMIDPQ